MLSKNTFDITMIDVVKNVSTSTIEKMDKLIRQFENQDFVKDLDEKFGEYMERKNSSN